MKYETVLLLSHKCSHMHAHLYIQVHLHTHIHTYAHTMKTMVEEILGNSVNDSGQLTNHLEKYEILLYF